MRWPAGQPQMKAAARILVVDDEAHLAAGIRENLEAEGYRTDVAHDGAEGLDRLRAEPFDLVVLDVMMPNMDGLELCAQLRARGHSNAGAVPDRQRRRRGPRARLRGRRRRLFVEAVSSAGAAAARRRDPAPQLVVPVGTQVDARRSAATASTSRPTKRAWDGSAHSLTHKEAMILRVLAEQPGTIVTREDILDRVWGYEVFPSTRTIDNFIVRLRKRFERNAEAPAHFHTVRGVGYRFTGRSRNRAAKQHRGNAMPNDNDKLLLKAIRR